MAFMTTRDKAIELVKKFGKEAALEIANMIFKEHYEYSDPNYTWRGDKLETYTNKERCYYWNEVRTILAG